MKVEVAILVSQSLKVVTVSVDTKQHWTQVTHFLIFFLPSVVERACRADRTLVREDHTAGSNSADTVYCIAFCFFTPIWVHLSANAPVGAMYNIHSFSLCCSDGCLIWFVCVWWLKWVCYSFCYWLYLYQIWHQEICGVQNHAFWFVFEWG